MNNIPAALCPQTGRCAAVEQQFGRDVTQVSTLSPIIGAHTGPGLVALIFYAPGSKR